MKQSRVFVVQQPAYYDKDQGKWINKFDISAAEEYGKLVFLKGPGNIYKNDIPLWTEVFTKMLNVYNDDDYILVLGDPIAIALAEIIASKFNKYKINILKYDRIKQKYESYTIDLDPVLKYFV